MRRTSLALVLLAVTTAACSGPEARVDFGGKAVPINVAFGKPPGVPKPASGPVTLRPAPNGIGVVPFVPGLGPVPRRPGPGVPTSAPSGSPSVASVPCPSQDPLRFPRKEATNLVGSAVPEGTYPYRIKGSFTINGTKTPYNETLSTKVDQIEADTAGRRRYQLSFRLLGVPYTVTYVVQDPVEAVAGEIALSRAAQDSEDDSGPVFEPVEPLRLLQLRAERGITWTDVGADPLSSSTSTVDGEIIDKVRVNACGVPVEAWKSVVTQRVVTPGQDITSTRTLFFATGMGGLLVGEQVSFKGTAGSDTVSGESTSTINVDPAA